MAFPFVQAGSVVTGGSSVAPSIAGTTSGNTLILTVTWDAATASVGAPTTPSGWTVVGSISGTDAWNATGPTSGGVIVYYQTSAGGTVNPTVTGATNTTDMVAQISEWSASASLSYASATANVNNTSNQTTVVTGTITPPQANYLLITVGASSGSTSTDTLSQSTTGTSAPTLTSLGSFTNGSTTMDALFEYGIGTTTNTLTTTYTCNTQTGMATMGVVFKYTPASGSPVTDNPTTAISQARMPEVLQSMLLGSLLLTALAPGVPPLPLNADNSGMIALQEYLPAPKRYLNADTSRSTPKTLFSDATTPAQDAPAFGPVHHPRNEGLNQDTSRGNWLVMNASRRFLDHFYGPQEYRRAVEDTSQSSPQGLIGVAPAPFVSALWGAPTYPWRVSDTGQSTPKSLYSDAVSPSINAPQFQVDRQRQVADTSQSSGIALTTGVQSPFQSPAGWAPYRFNWQPPDTSQSVAKVQTPDASVPASNLFLAAPEPIRSVVNTSLGAPQAPAAPFTAEPSSVPPRFWWQPADSSQGIAKAITPDAVTPAANVFLQAPEPARSVWNTSQGLTPPIVPPISNETGRVSLRYWWQPSDTSQATPKAAYFDATAPAQNPSQSAPERARQSLDTTVGSSIALTSLAPAPFVQSAIASAVRFAWQNGDTSTTASVALTAVAAPFFVPTNSAPEVRRNVADTSEETPKPLYQDASAPAGGSIASAPERGRQNGDTSQSSPSALWQQPPPSTEPIQSAPTPTRTTSDTSQSSPAALVAAAPMPFFELPASVVAYPWKISDTTSGAPKTLTPDAATPASNRFLQAPEPVRSVWSTAQGIQPPALPQSVSLTASAPHRFWWQPPDTSQSTPKSAYSDAVNPTVNPAQYQVDRIRPVTDTSRGPSQMLLATVLPPVEPVQQPGPHRYTWLPADTARGTPKTLYGDSTVPAQAEPASALQRPLTIQDTSQGTARALVVTVPSPFSVMPSALVERPRQLEDTSAPTPKVMYADAAAPFQAEPGWPSPRFWYQPSDTSQSIGKSLYGDASIPASNAPQALSDKPRYLSDTSASTAGVLLRLPSPFSNPPGLLLDRRIRLLEDTSQPSGISLTQAVFPVGAVTPWSGPQRYQYQSDTSLSTSRLLASVVILPGDDGPVIPARNRATLLAAKLRSTIIKAIQRI